MDHPSMYRVAEASMGTLTPRGLADLNSPVNMPSTERLTLQREANDVVEQTQRAHAILDMLTGAPSEQTKGSAVPLTLNGAISTARGEIARLVERIDGLLGALGQVY